MATAVEESQVVICCVSRRYRNSQACRTEAEYAFQQRKRIIPVIFEKSFKPTGWLGALLGTRLYFSVRLQNSILHCSCCEAACVVRLLLI